MGSPLSSRHFDGLLIKACDWLGVNLASCGRRGWMRGCASGCSFTLKIPASRLTLAACNSWNLSSAQPQSISESFDARRRHPFLPRSPRATTAPRKRICRARLPHQRPRSETEDGRRRAAQAVALRPDRGRTQTRLPIRSAITVATTGPGTPTRLGPGQESRVQGQRYARRGQVACRPCCSCWYARAHGLLLHEQCRMPCVPHHPSAPLAFR